MNVYLVIFIVVLLAFVVIAIARGMARHDPPQSHHWPAQAGGDGPDPAQADGKDSGSNR